MRLAPTDEELAKDEIAEKLDIPREDINQIIVTDWITGEVLVFFRAGRKPQRTFLEPTTESTPEDPN